MNGSAAPGLPGRVAVVGVGLIGGSLCDALRRVRPAIHLTGIDRDPQALRLAAEAGICDLTADVPDALAGADLVVIATPLPEIPEWIERCVAWAGDAVVTDVGGVKGAIVAAGARLLPGRFVGGHPMAGSERSGVGARNPRLFDGACWVLCPPGDAAEAPAAGALAAVRALVLAAGATPLVLPAARHDHLVALVSHLPHLLAAALIRATLDADSATVAASGFAGATRLAAGPPALHGAVLHANRDALADALRRLGAELVRAGEAVGDQAALTEYLETARERRSAWRPTG